MIWKSADVVLVRRLGALLLTLPTITACAAQDDAGVDPASDYPADVGVVDSHEPVWNDGAGWRFDGEPILQIGVEEGDEPYQLFRVVGGTRLSSGHIVIANAGTHELRFYDPQGLHLRSVGRQGDGPGEFQQLAGLWKLRGDSIAVHDFQHRRLTIFDSAGEYARDVRAAFDPSQELRLPPTVAAVFRDGRFVVQEQGTMRRIMQADGLIRDSSEIVLHAADGSRVRSLGRYPAVEIFVTRLDRQSWNQSLPFSSRTAFAFGADRIAEGLTDRYEIRLHDADGRLLRVFRRTDAEPGRVTEDLIQHHIRQMMEPYARLAERNPGLPPADEERARWEAMPRVATLPAFSGLRIDATGHVWVAQYRPMPEPGAPRRADVFDPDGRWLGTVEMLASTNTLEIGADYLLGIHWNDVGIERIRLHELIKP